ncbi:unnamed protein product [Camellia sinensis]
MCYHRTSTTDIAALATAAHHHGSRHRRSPSRPPSQPHSEYSINAILDALLMKKLATGQLFVGQKLRIWGAGLSGWAGPVSPLEASSTVGKGGGAPLAFRCIKGMGGPVPSTLIGVTQIYPVLYRERLSNGGFIVRSERMEAKMIQLYKQSLWIRISAKDALDAEYFWTDPLPCDPRSLPKYESSHEFQTKKKRQQQRQNEEMAKRQKLQHPQQHARTQVF